MTEVMQLSAVFQYVGSSKLSSYKDFRVLKVKLIKNGGG